MKKLINKFSFIIPFAIFLIVSFYAISLLFFASYYGFHIETSGIVKNIFTKDSPLRIGDQILSINSIDYEAFITNPYLEVFAEQPNNVDVEFEVLRDDEIHTYLIKTQDFIKDEFFIRAPNMYIVGFAFWLIGTICYLVIRPKNTEWKVLVAVCYLTAIWLSAGSLSIYKLYYSGMVFRVSFWLSIPFYFLIHWLIGAQNVKLSKKFLFGLFTPFVVLSILQIFKLIDQSAYSFGLIIAIVSSLGILIYKFIKFKKIRSDILFIVFIWAIILVPQIFISAILKVENFPTFGLSLLLLPLLPLSYINIIFKRESGKLRFRKNPIIASYLYFSILMILISIFMGSLILIFDLSTRLVLIMLFLILGVSIFSTFFYLPFIKWISSQFLGTIFPFDNVINMYSEQISRQESVEDLKYLIQNNLTKDLLIDSSWISLVSDLNSNTIPPVILDDKKLPNKLILSELQNRSSIEEPFKDTLDYKWIRLIIPIKSSNTFYGWWFIGEHDPDDVFSYDLIETLEVIGIQIAMKISSILQTQHIKSMYEIRVNREEVQESYILHELHDTVLNEFALLKNEIEDSGVVNEKIESYYEIISSSIRNTIAGLRPPMQDYPLYNSIEDFCYQMNQSKKIPINNNIRFEPEIPFKYDDMVKLNIYRMIQQGINNALEHAMPSEITLYGRLEEDYILIEICDDGAGINFDINLESFVSSTINELIQNKHFGIAGMYERATLIGASFEIESEPTKGTTVIVEWTKKNNNNVKVQDIE